MGYSFSEEKFITSFNAKSTEEKSADSMRLTHKPDGAFKLFPYKASGKPYGERCGGKSGF